MQWNGCVRPFCMYELSPIQRTTAYNRGVWKRSNMDWKVNRNYALWLLVPMPPWFEWNPSSNGADETCGIIRTKNQMHTRPKCKSTPKWFEMPILRSLPFIINSQNKIRTSICWHFIDTERISFAWKRTECNGGLEPFNRRRLPADGRYTFYYVKHENRVPSTENKKSAIRWYLIFFCWARWARNWSRSLFKCTCTHIYSPFVFLHRNVFGKHSQAKRSQISRCERILWDRKKYRFRQSNGTFFCVIEHDEGI